jgi:hypothetical protein
MGTRGGTQRTRAPLAEKRDAFGRIGCEELLLADAKMLVVAVLAKFIDEFLE